MELVSLEACDRILRLIREFRWLMKSRAGSLAYRVSTSPPEILVGDSEYLGVTRT